MMTHEQMLLPLFPFEDNACYVYFFQAGDFIKIGYSQGLKSRRSELQTSNPHELRLVKFFRFEELDNAVRAEQDFHEYFKEYHVRGEWFAIKPQDIPEHIPHRADAKLLAVMLTMAHLKLKAIEFLKFAELLKAYGEFSPKFAFHVAMNKAASRIDYLGDYWGRVILYSTDDISINDINEALLEWQGVSDGS